MAENDTEHLHFPGLGEDAAHLLVERKVPVTYFSQFLFMTVMVRVSTKMIFFLQFREK